VRDGVTYAEMAVEALGIAMEGRGARVVMTLRDDGSFDLAAEGLPPADDPRWTRLPARVTESANGVRIDPYSDQMMTLHDQPETLHALRRLAAERPGVRLVLRLPARAARW
jgi:hypothetical protein